MAAALWLFAFRLGGPSFWIKISFSAALLAGLSIWLQGGIGEKLAFNGRAWALGLASAALLYLIFWLGRTISLLVFSNAAGQIGHIYDLGHGFPSWITALTLFFVTGPSEEIYWRGFLQDRLMVLLGPGWGFLVATALYAGVHLWTLNFILIGAALVAGAFWGLMYWRFHNLAANILSHSIWTVVVFSLMPLQ